MLQKIMDRQAELGLSDREFCALVGMSSWSWRATRQGKRRLGRAILVPVASAFPDLRAEIAEYILMENPR